MPGLPPPVLRAMEGLAESSGRTIAVAGPPLSGKSALLEELRGQLRGFNARLIELRGTYRNRSVPYGGLEGLRDRSPGPSGDGLGPDATPSEGPMVPIPFPTERLPRSRRGRGDRGRATIMGQPVRGRAASEGEPDRFWQEILPEFQGPDGHPVAILVEDGALFDTESREFVVALSKRARLRPFLIVVALDTSVPGYSGWEEAYLCLGDVDWVRIPGGQSDPREAHRLKALFDDLPSVSQRVAGFVALLGGTVGEVVLSRVCRLTFPQLAEALLPATGVGYIKVVDGKVSIPHLAWVPLTVDLLADKERREMHLEIANALSALSPEPSLARRIEVARHYLAWFPGPMALRHLLEAAEISLQLLAFDSAEELLASSISCLPSLPPSERDPLEPELRLLHSRALFAAGRISEAESELREGVEGGLRAKFPSDTLTEWLEPLLPLMRAVGPRPSLSTTLLELIERCHDNDLVEIEVLFEALVAEFHHERNWNEKARAESHRAALLARRLPEGHLQALALLAVGLSRIEGSRDEQRLAERFLRAARFLLGRARRWELDALAEDLEAQLLEARGDTQRARELRERSLPALQRAKLTPLELSQQLGLVQLLLNRGQLKGVEPALQRAHQLSETLHLLPPSPALLRLWLLEGRWMAVNEQTEGAQDRWSAILDAPTAATIPRLRAEAIVRLALLEHASRRTERATEIAQQLDLPEVRSALPEGWSGWVSDLARLAAQSDRGGGPLPPPPSLERRGNGERRERGRREPVGDSYRPHHQKHDDHDTVQQLGPDASAQLPAEEGVPARHDHERRGPRDEHDEPAPGRHEDDLEDHGRVADLEQEDRHERGEERRALVRPEFDRLVRLGVEVEPDGVADEEEPAGDSQKADAGRAENGGQDRADRDGDPRHDHERARAADPDREGVRPAGEGDEGEAGPVEQFEEPDDEEDRDEPGRRAEVDHAAPAQARWWRKSSTSRSQ